MAQLTFTPAHEAAQQAYRDFTATAAETKRHEPVAEYHALMEQGRVRDAADFVERFLVQTLGYTQYAGEYAGELVLIRVTRRYTSKSGFQFHEGDLAFAKVIPADEMGPEMMIAWSPRTSFGVPVTRSAYQIVGQVPARQG